MRRILNTKLLLLLLVLLTGGCNLTQLAANSTVDVFATAAPSFEKESDVELARAAGLANLKMLEGLIEVVPRNRTLLELNGKSFASYAFGFLEADLEQMDSLSDEYEALAARTVDFYLRGQRYTGESLELMYPGFLAAANGSDEDYEKILKTIDPIDVSTLFWFGYAWGGAVNLQVEDPASVIDLPKVVSTMKRVIELDETTHYGSAHLVLGVAQSALPKALGGDPDAALKHFQRAHEIAEGKYLMGEVMLARFYHGRANLNQEAFESTLESVLDTDSDILPEQRLANELAKLRAAYWLGQVDEIF